MPSADANAPVLHVNVRRVMVDVVVTDAHGKPVQNLGSSDFQVYEDGVLKPVRSFEEHREDAVAATKLDLPPGTYSNFSLAPSRMAPTVLLYDLLDTPLQEQAYAHAQLVAFLKERRLGGQMAVFVLRDKLHMLQSFSDDPDQLSNALNGPGAQRFVGDMTGHSDGETGGGIADFNSSVLRDHRDRLDEAMRQLAHFLGVLPGRKNLIWLTGAVPIDFVPLSRAGDDGPGGAPVFEGLGDLMNLNGISVYPIDSGGLRTSTMMGPIDLYSGFTANHQIMDAIAETTGGHAFYNDNGLKACIGEAIGNGSNYYSLTFAPSENKTSGFQNPLDASRRKVRVKLAPSGFNLEYRRSFFTSDVEAIVRRAAKASADSLDMGLRHGLPVEHGVKFVAHVQAVGKPSQATRAQREALSRYRRKIEGTDGRIVNDEDSGDKASVTQDLQVRTYTVRYALPLRQLGFAKQSDGVRRVDLDLAVMAYDADGIALIGVFSKSAETLTPEEYQSKLSKGYTLMQSVDVPLEAAFLRVGVRDNLTQNVGSLEISLPLADVPAAGTR